MILVMSDVLPLAEVKAKFSEMVDRVEQQHDRITVTRNGRPAAVLMSADDLAALEDTLELLSDPTAMTEIDQARRDGAAGNTVSADALRAKYLRPGPNPGGDCASPPLRSDNSLAFPSAWPPPSSSS
jgi:prevent-host-death family protein